LYLDDHEHRSRRSFSANSLAPEDRLSKPSKGFLKPVGSVGRQAGDYLRQYGKSHGVQISDALIAAAAVLNRAELWTRNRKNYPM
jgi:hypothetical protein